MKLKVKTIHPLQWITEPLEEHPTFIQRKMFGCEMIGLHGKQMVVLAAKDEPWNGLMVCTSREHHASLIKDFRVLKPHPILGKWLYVSQGNRDFEETVAEITQRVLIADPRIGIESKPKKRKTGTSNRRKK